MILVLGSPSGGTSVVAGVLHQLGVEMYEKRGGTGPRSYERYECQVCYNSVIGPVWPPNRIRPVGSPADMTDLFRQYISRRTGGGQRLVGVKHARLALMGLSRSLSDLNLKTIRVVRPIQDVIASNCRYADLGERLGAQTEFERKFVQASLVGALEWCRMEFFEKVPPVATVDYCELLAKPNSIVANLAGALGLEPTGEQHDLAVNLVDRKQRHF